MGKVTKICDFDRPESPVERIVRGLKIALDGEKAAIKAGKGNDFTKQLKEMIFCAQDAETMRNLEAKYAAEIKTIKNYGGEVHFDFRADPTKPKAVEIEYIKDKVTNTYPDQKFLVKEAAKFAKKEAGRRGQKAKIRG